MLDTWIEPLLRVVRSPSNELQDAKDAASIAARDQRVQLQPNEIRQVLHAIRHFDRCRLLVFGAGYDSALWESLNATGTTVFIEDNVEWIATIQPLLKSSEIHHVRYGTRLSEWRQLLGQTRRLELELPRSVLAHRWDVILVDGPPGYAGYRDPQGREAPGRMQSIFTASRLVARTGYVFVHDCERDVEHAYAMRYLTRSRQFVKVEGWAELRGFRYGASRLKRCARWALASARGALAVYCARLWGITVRSRSETSFSATALETAREPLPDST